MKENVGYEYKNTEKMVYEQEQSVNVKAYYKGVRAYQKRQSNGSVKQQLRPA